MLPQNMGDETNFQIIVAKLGKEAIQQATDLLSKPPDTKKYEALKNRLLAIYEESENQQIQKLIGEMELGDQKQSQLLRRMRDLAREKMKSRPAGYLVEVRASLGSSDHCLVSSKVPLTPLTPSALPKRQIWRYSSADWDGMLDYFASIPWGQRCFSGKDPKASATAVADEIVLGMEYYIPHYYLISKGRRYRWFNRECANAVDIKQAAYRAWTRDKSLGDPETRSLKTAYNYATKSKRAYIRPGSKPK